MEVSRCSIPDLIFSNPDANKVIVINTLEQLTLGRKGTNKSDAEKERDKEVQKIALVDFFNGINSLLNSDGGFIVIHGTKEPNVHLFDQKVYSKVPFLNPDNVLYPDVFERGFLDENHLYYRVKPRNPERPLSILDSKTRFAVSKGTVDPTQGQMRDFMKHVIQEEGKPSSKVESYNVAVVLKKDKPAELQVPQARCQGIQTLVGHFGENICTQAKKCDPSKQIVDFGWEKLQSYISAFSKLSNGGSVFLGVAEEKCGDKTTGRLLVEGVDATQSNEQELQKTLLDREHAVSSVARICSGRSPNTASAFPAGPHQLADAAECTGSQIVWKETEAAARQIDIAKLNSKHQAIAVTQKLETYNKADYIRDTTLIGADPLQQTCPLVHKSSNDSKTPQRKILTHTQNKKISQILEDYAGDSSDWQGWMSTALPEYFDLRVTTQAPPDSVQVFLAGVDLPPMLLTVCQDVARARDYAHETASALKWRLLDFCHLDFLLLPCVSSHNFDLNSLINEITDQLEKLSKWHRGPTHLDEITFQTMKAAASALSGSTCVPGLLEDSGSGEMETLVMEKEWRDVLFDFIETWSADAKKSDHPLMLHLDPGHSFKEKVARVEAMKRLSVRNRVIILSPAPDTGVERCLQSLKQDLADKYSVTLQIEMKTTQDEATGSL